MGLYIAMSLFWIHGIIRIQFWRMATMSNIVFMGGLAAGRTISFIADGMPSKSFVIGYLLEIALLAWGLLNLKKY
jgi:hypothetical protein